MTATVIRLTLSIILLPSLLILFGLGIAFFQFMLNFDPMPSTFISGILTFTTAVVGWLLIWRGHVKWDQARRGRVLRAFLISLGLSVLIAGVFYTSGLRQSQDFSELMIVANVFVTCVTWLVLCTFALRSDRKNGFRLSGLDVPIHCPACGYDMRGVGSTTCSECGSAFTLEQILLAQIVDHELRRPERK